MERLKGGYLLHRNFPLIRKGNDFMDRSRTSHWKVIGVFLALVALAAVLLIGAACEGPAGSTGDQGPIGLTGDTGPAGPAGTSAGTVA